MHHAGTAPTRKRQLSFGQKRDEELEGNPAAIAYIARGWRLLPIRDDAKALLEQLLYGTFEPDIPFADRFLCSIVSTIADVDDLKAKESKVSVLHLAPFWTIVPKDISYYTATFIRPPSPLLPHINTKSALASLRFF